MPSLSEISAAHRPSLAAMVRIPAFITLIFPSITASYESLSEAQREKVPQVLRVWLRSRSEKYFGEGRIVEFDEDYFETTPYADLLLRAAYNYRNIDLVMHLAGLEA